MTMKKIPTYITAFVLGALVLSGCSNVFFEKPRQDSGGETASPDILEGFGTVQVSLSQGAARTIMPAADLAGLYLEYWFAKDNGNPEQKTPAGDIFTLKPGSYTLAVKAFADDGYADLAAQGVTDTAFTITAGTVAPPVNVTLHPVVIGEGTGSLEFGLEYPEGVTVETFVLTRIAGAETPIDLAAVGTSSGSGPVTFSGTKAAIPVGYYLLRVALKNSAGASSGRVEVVHIYQNLKSEAHYGFIADDFRAYRVTTNANSGPGSLRQALTNVLSGTGEPRTIQVLLEPGSVIALESRLTIVTNLIIEGNGVTLTRAASWISSDDSSQLLYISSSTAEIAIRRVHFKNGLATYGGAIYNYSGILTLESCIFSGNHATSTSGNAYGGAIADYSGILTIRGSTFYNNNAGYAGGAIYSSGILALTGNVFYGNSAQYQNVVYNTDTVTSYGYNVSDKATGTSASGWTFDATDVQATAMPVGPASFKPLPGLAAEGLITTRPGDYPTMDFYGDPIPASGAHAGAVQALPSGYRLDVVGQGSISVISGNADADGLYAYGTTVKLRVEPDEGRLFEYWKVGGEMQPVQTPAEEIEVTITANMVVEAVCGIILVTSGADSGPGTLRQALANAQSGDTIILDLTGDKIITLTSGLSFTGAVNFTITIEGSGATLTQTGMNRLLSIPSSGVDVTIRRLHFKDGNYASPFASGGGGAISNYGKLTLESCIFSGNRATSTSSYTYGGAIYNSSGILTIRGCTFYNNAAVCTSTSSDSRGGAIFTIGMLTLTGNVFYENSAVSYSVVDSVSSPLTSDGYNVSDKASGTSSGYSGWTFATTDVQAVAMPVGSVSFKPLLGLAAVGKITARPEEYWTLPRSVDTIKQLAQS
jgi:hypothetical protein